MAPGSFNQRTFPRHLDIQSRGNCVIIIDDSEAVLSLYHDVRSVNEKLPLSANLTHFIHGEACD
ncbi:hypothetical protein GCM10023116_20500 [Kistimonas scapharcae]|uniref:Uncharacterized protein n=1 Tax=Kistimonas scapharcae TaxID=1036133 RepID=A0ABP8V309_9GAMM